LPSDPPPSGPALRVAVLADLPNAGTACAEGRRFVGEQLWRWEVGLQVADTTELVASELIANAVRHGRPPLRLALRLHRERVRLEVTDSSPRPPLLTRPRLTAIGGRGLWLVDTLSVEWGSYPEPPGKVVWCEVPVAEPLLPMA
jgi:anti-sigma regulatory factor (Ser/Thr protein kinase)